MVSEILFAIIDELDRVDIIDIALTCQALFHIALTFVATDIQSTSGSWTNPPLTSIGSYLKSSNQLSPPTT